MAATNYYSEQFILELFTAEHNVESDVLKAILMVPAFTFESETDATYADVIASEIASGNGYTTGGQTLTSVAASIASNIIKIDCDDPSWTASGGAIADIGGMVVYNSTHANDTIICCLDFDVTYSPGTGTTFKVYCANGLIKGTPVTS